MPTWLARLLYTIPRVAGRWMAPQKNRAFHERTFTYYSLLRYETQR